MNEIYVTGHRNPDTDSIVAAMSYAALKNALGEKEYVAVHLGTISDETNRMLKHFGFKPPRFIQNVRTQVRDLDFDRPPCLDASVTMDRAWQLMRSQKISAIPVTNEDGTLYGMLSAGDIATFSLNTIANPVVEEVPMFNLLSVIEGRVVGEGGDLVDSLSGSVSIALPQNCENLLFDSSDSIVLCGSQPDMIRRALDMQVSCLILCQTDVDPEWVKDAGKTCIISTPFDASRVHRLIYQAIPIARVCKKKDIVAFHLSDYVDDVREVLLKSRYRCYPILDEHDHVVGTLSRFHLLRPRRKRVVLVDHNEISQSVHGLDQVEIMEIIDHHRLADIQTNQPISVRNEPVGSTNTIITSMYQEYGVMPSPKIAGLMASAILSDTVMFKSPTCTKKDITMAKRLSRIANVPLEELGKRLFSFAGADGKTAEELLRTDYKQFHIAEQNIAVSQITCDDSEHFMSRSGEFLEVMQKLRTANEYDIIILMITDVLLEGSHLFYVGSDDIMQQAFSVVPKDNHLFLPKVMSRKKQVIPMLTALWG